MELQIQDLVSSIKKEGIETARREADAIVAEAKAQAETIIAEAKAQAEKTLAASQKEAEALKDSAKIGAEQARRDAVLSFKSEVQGEFEKLLRADVGKSVQGETLASLIKAALNGEDVSAYSAEVAEVTEGLRGELKAEMENGLELKASKKVRGGFRLAAKDGSGYFDCSDEEIAGMLMPFFSNLSM